VACVEQILAENRTTYGINTGFGLLASTKIASEDLENLQRSMVLSHAAGVGEPITMPGAPDHGAQGQQPEPRFLRHPPGGDPCADRLINAEVYPHIPLKGSVGASGDLAPLAHMSLVLLGEGKARYKVNGCLPPRHWKRQA
jgi:histidine ammonia-lyase